MVTVLAWTVEGPGFKSWLGHLFWVGMLYIIQIWTALEGNGELWCSAVHSTSSEAEITARTLGWHWGSAVICQRRIVLLIVCCCILAGDDAYGRKVIVLSACRLPAREDIDHEKLLMSVAAFSPVCCFYCKHIIISSVTITKWYALMICLVI